MRLFSSGKEQVPLSRIRSGCAWVYVCKCTCSWGMWACGSVSPNTRIIRDSCAAEASLASARLVLHGFQECCRCAVGVRERDPCRRKTHHIFLHLCIFMSGNHTSPTKLLNLCWLLQITIAAKQNWEVLPGWGHRDILGLVDLLWDQHSVLWILRSWLEWQKCLKWYRGTVEALLLFSRSVVSDSVTPWTAARQSVLKFMSIELVIPSNHLILCCPFLLLPLIFPSIRLFLMSQLFAPGGQSIRASASASVLLMNIEDWFPLGLTALISLLEDIKG